MEWVIACDQPFEEVQRPEFIAMMNYTHHSGTLLKIPKRNGIKRCLMKMGDDTIENVCRMFLVCSYNCFQCNVLIPSFQCRLWREKSLYHSTHGHQAISMRFWPSLRTTYLMTGNLVRVFIDSLTRY